MAPPIPANTPDLTNQAIPLVFYDQYTPDKATHWLAWRESVVDPEHTLNKSPLLTLMVMSKWFQESPALATEHPKAALWTEQLVVACAAWSWTANSTSTELYCRLGHLLSDRRRLAFIQAWPQDDTRIGPLLAWCEHLEDNVRPTTSAAIMYKLQDEGIAPSAPQDAIVDALFEHLTRADQPVPSMPSKENDDASSSMGILWSSQRVFANATSAARLAHKAPRSLPSAIERCLVRRIAFKAQPYTPASDIKPVDADDLLVQHMPIFAMDPCRSDPTQLLDALLLSHDALRGSMRSPSSAQPTQAAHVWQALCNAWPVFTGLLQTTVMVEGPDALGPKHPMRPTLVGYIADLQKGKMPSTLAVEGMFEAVDGLSGP